MKTDIRKNDLLFHASHGLCRVTTISKSPASKEMDYSLLPVNTNHAKVRFVIPQSSFENSGFNKLISPKDAHSILEFFKTGKKKDSSSGQAWEVAEMISLESSRKDAVKDNKKQQRLSVCVKSLASELAFVLNTTVPEITEKMRKNLRAVSAIHPLVLNALVHADKD